MRQGRHRLAVEPAVALLRRLPRPRVVQRLGARSPRPSATSVCAHPHAADPAVGHVARPRRRAPARRARRGAATSPRGEAAWRQPLERGERERVAEERPRLPSRPPARTPRAGVPGSAASRRRSVSDRPSRADGYSRASRPNASPRKRSSARARADHRRDGRRVGRAQRVPGPHGQRSASGVRAIAACAATARSCAALELAEPAEARDARHLADGDSVIRSGSVCAAARGSRRSAAGRRGRPRTTARSRRGASSSVRSRASSSRTSMPQERRPHAPHGVRPRQHRALVQRVAPRQDALREAGARELGDRAVAVGHVQLVGASEQLRPGRGVGLAGAGHAARGRAA